LRETLHAANDPGLLIGFVLLLAFRALRLLRPRDEPATHGCSLAAIPPSFPPA
jgi:hypothetical protein